MNHSVRWSVLGVLAFGIPCLLFLVFLFLMVFFRLGHPGWMAGQVHGEFWQGRGPLLFPALLFLGLGGLIQLALGVWVAADAHRRGMNGFLWGILVFFTFIIGLIVYLIVTRADSSFGVPPASDAPASKGIAGTTCNQCQARVQPEFQICPFCGNSLRSQCPKCGRPVASDWKVCPFCAGPVGSANG